MCKLLRPTFPMTHLEMRVGEISGSVRLPLCL